MVFLALAVWIWAFLECIPTVINDEAIECDPIPLGGKVLFTALAAAVSAILAVVTGAIVAHLLGESTWGRSSKGSSR